MTSLNFLPTFLIFFLFLFLIMRRGGSLSNTLSITESLELSKNNTLVSSNNLFELGFFQSQSKWYLGNWWKQDKTVLWVANRNVPLLGSYGVLKFMKNNLVILNQSGDQIWSTYLSGSGVRSSMWAELHNNGNLVLKYINNPTGYVWQSFDHPTDTLLPGMKLDPVDPSKRLYSWVSSDDPSAGYLWLGIMNYPDGIFAIDVTNYRMDTWNGYRFGDLPPVFQLNDNADSFLMNTFPNSYSRLTMSPDGFYYIHTWVPGVNVWNMSFSMREDACYRGRFNTTCGSYSICSKNASCHCIQGVTEKPEGGCIRRNALKCNEDIFEKLQKMKLPEDGECINGSSYSVEECENVCLKDCDCKSFALVESRKSQRVCVKWTGVLKGMRTYTFGGQDLYIRVAASDNEDHAKTNGKNKDLDPGIIVLIVLSCIILLGIVCLAIFCCWKKHKRSIIQGGPTQTEIVMSEIDTPESFQLMEFGVIFEATNHFSESNKVGQGGFGPVYKGNEIAVKRLKARSSQGMAEFRNEVTLILRVLHVNLVRLLGCCIHGYDRLLVYEFLENSSLSSYIFNQTRSPLLNWEHRFDIMKGIAEGLCYLHNFTSPPILHRDLKPSNVLLGRDMIPKISDFGLAQMMETGTTEAAMETAVGTYGYMSEEYAKDNIMSQKSDVFSYGVVLLEILTGRRNHEYCIANPGDSLLDFVWRRWKDGTGLEVVDSSFHDDSFIEDQVLRSMKIGLSCVQQNMHDRPSTRTIVVMFENGPRSEILDPTRPNYNLTRADSSSSPVTVTDQSVTINEATLSCTDAR
ncbi:receptor-like serine/threonine-protein kinase SD1-8 [Brassica napus]|uniref:receptor-like serine/threonine-protein kinase SD1-8 n=1 Tax=Brassica napus TaxID=3708 RepID=UPI002078644F|nr:receptor-like serine/threonine-protein kinase SD1-8 [Brassica napus]